MFSEEGKLDNKKNFTLASEKLVKKIKNKKNII